jgi:hypothetical protein
VKRSILLLFTLLITASSARAERVVFAGFDVSATAFAGHTNPYDEAWYQILKTVQGGDQVFAAVINEYGLTGGAPAINFSIRRFNIFKDQSMAYDAAVAKKLNDQRNALDHLLNNTAPARQTEVIGTLVQAGELLGAFARATRQIVLYTDSIQEGRDVNLARVQLSDAEITGIIARERRAGRLPALAGTAVWIITGPSLHGQVTTAKLLRLEKFWRHFVEASGGHLRSFSPVLSSFDHDSQ